MLSRQEVDPSMFYVCQKMPSKKIVNPEGKKENSEVY